MNRLLYIFVLASIAAGITLILILIYWISYPYKPLVFNTPVFPVKNKIVRQGGNLTYISDYCKFNDLNAVVSRTFTNGLVFITPPTTTYRPIGCQVINVVVSIPAELPPGTYHLENIYSYHVNPIRIVTISQSTEKFEVIEASESAQSL